jgi:hypothetical protein
MANTFKVLFRGAASTGSTTLYTTPSATTTLISSILVTNTAGSAATYDILLDDVAIANDVNVPANDSALLEIKQVIEAGQTIKALASATTVNFHISGLEIS